MHTKDFNFDALYACAGVTCYVLEGVQPNKVVYYAVVDAATKRTVMRTTDLKDVRALTKVA